jgi:hypothetical protein
VFSKSFRHAVDRGFWVDSGRLSGRVADLHGKSMLYGRKGVIPDPFISVGRLSSVKNKNPIQDIRERNRI